MDSNLADNQINEVVAYILGTAWSDNGPELVVNPMIWVHEDLRHGYFKACDIARSIFYADYAKVYNVLVDNKLIPAFLRGLLDTHGLFISETRDTPTTVVITSDEIDFRGHFMTKILDSLNIRYEIESMEEVSFKGPNAFDVLCRAYSESKIHGPRSLKAFEILNQVQGINNAIIPVIRVCCTDATAVMPSKLRGTDIGYDLTIIGIFKVNPTGTILYETGIVAQPPTGWYIEVVPRSKFSSTGWVIANSMGIIDKGYVGSIKVAVVRVSDDAIGEEVEYNVPGKGLQKIKSLPLPYDGFQMILRPHIHMDIREVSQSDIVSTERAAKGFGSRNTTIA